MTDNFSLQAGIPAGYRREAARLYWQAFSGKLGRVMRPEKTALDFISHVLDEKFALSAVSDDEELLGIAGYKTSEGSFIGGELEDLAQFYGWTGALWRGALLHLLERHSEPGLLLMDGIFVREESRGSGVGSKLLEAIYAESKSRNLNGVRLDVIDINPRARKLYEREGFTPTATTKLSVLRPLFGFSSATTMVRLNK